MSVASEELAERIRALIGYKPGVVEKRMFGGAGFMLNGNMVCGAMASGNLLLRVGPDLYAEARRRSGAQAMYMGGREMVGFVEVTDDFEDKERLKAWLDIAWGFVTTLPAKAETPAPKAARPGRKAARARRSY
ncbi:MAG TPA: TfoX/Sxy family protein [Alphaproteobacteria bacterium]|nr:TfoX/Sxy family protein [Alphaproteobacteria bacterium]